MKNKKTTIFLLTFFFLLAAAFMTYYYKVNREQPKRLPLMGEGDHRVRSFAFTDQEGKTVTNDDVKGKIYAVEYFFTTCKGICPKMNENMAEVYQAFRGNKDVLILSHTVDPVKDSVKAMKAYSLKYDADPNQWLFLTGDKKELYDMARYSYRRRRYQKRLHTHRPLCTRRWHWSHKGTVQRNRQRRRRPDDRRY